MARLLVNAFALVRGYTENLIVFLCARSALSVSAVVNLASHLDTLLASATS
jgi:hypothetical protein